MKFKKIAVAVPAAAIGVALAAFSLMGESGRPSMAVETYGKEPAVDAARLTPEIAVKAWECRQNLSECADRVPDLMRGEVVSVKNSDKALQVAGVRARRQAIPEALKAIGIDTELMRGFFWDLDVDSYEEQIQSDGSVTGVATIHNSPSQKEAIVRRVLDLIATANHSPKPEPGSLAQQIKEKSLQASDYITHDSGQFDGNDQ